MGDAGHVAGARFTALKSGSSERRACSRSTTPIATSCSPCRSRRARAMRRTRSRLVDFMGSYPPGDMALGELRGPMAEETRSWLNRIALGVPTQHATAQEAHNRLMLTKALDLSAKRKAPIALPLEDVTQEAMHQLPRRSTSSCAASRAGRAGRGVRSPRAIHFEARLFSHSRVDEGLCSPRGQLAMPSCAASVSSCVTSGGASGTPSRKRSSRHWRRRSPGMRISSTPGKRFESFSSRMCRSTSAL